MAEIGVMKKLTIGGKTYTIPEYSLPIASASTLGGVRIGTGLVIESGTGILSATGTDVTIDSEMSDSSANPVQNQIIKAYIDQYKGTVTSVQVQATSPVQSSTSTAQNSSLNTTISLANGYGDTKNPYGTKTANYVLAGPTSGSAAAPSFRKLVAADIPDLSETYLTSYTETDPTVPSWAKASSKPTYTASEVGAASSTHTHGNLTNGGDITATAPTIANGDQIIINDNSASKITNGPTFDGSTTTTALTPKGTWESFSKFSGSYNDLSNKPTIPTVPTAVSAFTNDAGYITSADVPEGASAYTGTISAVSTTASNGTNNGFARGDHVHNITSSTITSALGYTPYDSTNPNGYISSYTDEKLKWTTSTTSNTYYPLQSTSTATTSTANTLNGISFYQYYNTAGGYRRLDLGNSTAYKSTGGAYGTIRLYGAAATYYGDLVPGVLGTTSGDGHISANRTWTLPDKTGTIALISDIPTTLPASDVSAWAKAASKPTYTASEVGALASDTTYVSTVTTTAGTHTAISNKSGTVSFNVPTNTSHLTNDSGFITSYTDTKDTAGSTDTSSKIFLIGATSQAANPQTYSHDTAYVGTDGCLYSGGAKVLTAHQDISGKLDTAGTGLSKSGTTLNHSNSVTAQTTQAIYPIKIDAQGHISAYGSAVTPLTASSSLNAAKLTGTVPSDCYTNTTYSAGTGLSLSSNSFSIKLGYTTSGNNRAVQADESGNLYVVQKDDNTTYSSKTAASGGTDVSLVTTGEKYTWNSKTSNTGTVTSITLTQGTGISIGSSGTAITTSGSRTISLATITKSNTTSTASPAHSGTFTAIDSITYDDYGRVTGVNTKTVTLPASGNTDAKVTQSATTTSDWRKVLVHYTTNTSGADVPASVTNQVYAAKGIEVQPSTGTLHAEALTTKKITPLITGGSQTAAVTTSPYKPALWKFNAGIVPANGDIVVIQAPGDGHSYGEFLSLDNGTTYKPITHSGTGKMTTHYASGSPIALVYDSDWTASSMYPLAGGTSTGTISGGAWRVINGYLDGNTYPQAQCETAAATAAKAASMSNFTATANRYIMVNIRYANTSATAITLNINGTGAKPIYINGSASSTSNYTLPAGSYLVFYNGTNYYFRTDAKITGSITGDAATVGGHTVGVNVPANAKFTDTTALTSMTGTLAIGHGGTGQTTAVNAANALIDALDTATANWTDSTLVLTSDVSGDTNVYYKRAATSAWNYIINKVYPVGAIYMSVNSTNPGTLFGGTWVAWGTGRVPVGINTSDTDFKTVEKTGGAKTVTLDLANVGAINASTEASGFGLTATSAFQNRVVVSTTSATAHSNLQPYITCYMWKRTA